CNLDPRKVLLLYQQPIDQLFLCQQHVHSIKQNRQFHQIDSSQYVIYSHKTSPLSFYHVMQFGLMIYDAEYVDFYKLAELLNQSINIVFLDLSSVPHVKRVELIHAYLSDESSFDSKAST